MTLSDTPGDGLDEAYSEYVCSYSFNGVQWGTTVFAGSEEEARRRLRAIGMTGQVDGALVARIPASPGTGLWLRPLVFLRNLIVGGRHG